MIARLLSYCLTLLLAACLATSHAQAAEVVAFWGFASDYDFDTNPTKQAFAADVDNTMSGDAILEAFRGDGDDLDDNGGGGFVSYTSPFSGVTYEPTRTIKWDDLAGGGDDFDIDGVDTFTLDKNDGAGAVAGEDFGNDALMYITFDGTGYSDFQFRFDIEGTPGDLPSSFDVFYRVDGPSGTWFRDADQNNISLTFFDYDPADPENQFADSGMISLSPMLDGSSTIELIISDFNEFGNSEMEIDNFEIVGQSVPEPSSIAIVALALVGFAVSRRK
ncbi:PEP-CTERM sorting domain-containing protein [Aeoliella mucimassa]|uniref:Ice-binding protein C-terminal domain-containing protein n=1 Tax=Aeoliella mucimassa TaxID=2527972 RepID=A0A518APB4_9BACT|nr:PEP-CTERM sorting domain-containing protein [Aeoliella mucimassa]QDU56552.1 hypothetical protein Pan181_27620 [Aeoliella mucimassa]